MRSFYEDLESKQVFDQLADDNAYTPLPDDWYVGMADIVGSTEAVKKGRYKMVNTVGAAVISAQINSAGDGRYFPFVFGGDGAAFAFWPERKGDAVEALAAVKRWAHDEFGIEMRAAVVSMKVIRAAGFDVTVAKYRASPGVDYAMFNGGGVSWAEDQMKSGMHPIKMADADVLPDLTGLSCRWTPMRSTRGSIVSLLVQPVKDADHDEVAGVMHAVVALASGLERGGHPVPEQGPGVSWPPEGLALEAHATRGRTSLLVRKLQLLFETFLAWIFFTTKWKANTKEGEFDPAHYAKTTGANSDFQKFDDGLKMTLDCTPETKSKLLTLLDAAKTRNIIQYGVFEQDESMLTCIVPSITNDHHFHFIDGAKGGYTMAAVGLKGG